MTHLENLFELEKVKANDTKDEAGPSDDKKSEIAQVKKSLDFFFRKERPSARPPSVGYQTHYDHHAEDFNEIFHTIAGQRRRGLVIEPGAANGLMGSETLRDLIEHCDMQDQVKSHLTWKDKMSSITGISGADDSTLGEVRLPLPMLKGLESSCYLADVIGGEASLLSCVVGQSGPGEDEGHHDFFMV